MLQKIKQIVNQYLFSETDNPSSATRTKIVLKSSAISVGVKVLTVILGLVTIPIVYRSLDKYQFGVYTTLTSIITWIDMFDFGIAAGLKNRLTEAITDNDSARGRKYISTAYCLLFFIAVFIFVVYSSFSGIINWQAILNAVEIERPILDRMAFYVLLFFLIRFVADTINSVYCSFQESYMGGVTQCIGKIVYLICVIVLTRTDNVSLFNIAFAQSFISAITPIIAALFFFKRRHPEYSPSVKCVDFSLGKDILGLGWQFFVIQLALLVIHSGNNLLISQFVDPASVPSYSLSYQLFSYTMMAYTIIIGPLWSAYTEAWRIGDVEWIRHTIKRIRHLFYLFVIGCLLMVICSPLIFRIWIGDSADVPILMSLAVAIMVLLDMWIRIYDYFINGVGKIRIQMIVNVVMACINIPMAYVFSVKCGFGAIGVVMASIVSYSISAIISPVQAKKLLSGTAEGLWNK